MRFSNQVVIVTGGASGLGLAIAEHMAHEGANVVIADNDAEAAEARAAALLDRGCRSLGIACDVQSPDQVEKMVEQTIQEFGSLDVLVSNAGIGGLYDFLDQPIEHWNSVIGVNLTGVFLCGQAAGRAMAKQGRGRIINIASIAAYGAGTGRAAYGTSKAGVIQLTRQMAMELGPLGINVNAIAPGPVDTPMVAANHTEGTRRQFTSRIPLGRYGTPNEIACAVAFLATPEASYINGQTLNVDGGFTSVGILASDVASGKGVSQ